MSTTLQDLRYAIRFYRRSPAFFFLAVSTLALGIGANAAIFTVVNGVLLRPLPLPGADRIAFFTRSGDVSIPDGVDWRARSRSFDSIALFLRSWDFNLTGQGEPERLNGAVAEPDFFRVLGVRPTLGRFYTKQDDRTGGPRVAVLGFDFWKRRFGGDRAILGRTLRLSDHAVTVIGVAPPETDFLHDGVELYVPPALETPWALEERGTNNFDAIGRMQPGVPIERARAEIETISRDLAREYPKTNARKIVTPILAYEFLVRSIRPALLILLGAVGLVLLLASANLASLLLARAAVRQPEIALRLALGAGRGRIFRQLVTEGLLLTSVGAGLGLALAALGKDLLLSLAPGAIPRAAEVSLDGRVILFAAALAFATGVAFGLAPAFGLGRTDPGLALQGGGRGAVGGFGRHRTLGAIASAEIALACILLVGSGLLLGSFSRLAGIPLGFTPSNVLTAQLVLPESRYGERAAQTRAFTSVVDRMRRIPGVEAAAYTIGVPLQPGGIGGSVRFEGRPAPPPQQRQSARAHPVVGDYFRAMRLPIIRGRALAETDREDSEPVAVVNREFVQLYFGSGDPLGKRIAWGWTNDAPWMTIVGIAADVKTTDVASPDDPAVYTPYSQRPVEWQRFGTLVLRTTGAPGGYARALREAVWSVDRDLTISQIQTMDEKKATALASQRFSALLLSVFGGAALLLSIQGVVGVLSFAVAQRRREIGIRIALGAAPRDVFGAVLGRALRLTGAGLAAGLLGALLLTRLLSGLLYGVKATDPATFAAAAILVFVAALSACALPARRATRVDPMTAIRGE